MNEHYKQILEGLAAFVASTALRVIASELITQLQKEKHSLIPLFQQMHENSVELTNNTNIDRVALLIVKKPRMIGKMKNKKWTATALYLYDKSRKDSVDNYQEVEVDNHYIDMVLHCKSKENREISIKEINEKRTVLTDIYRTVGVQSAIVRYVKGYEYTHFIASYTTRKGGIGTDANRERIRRNSAVMKDFLNALGT